MILLFVRIKPNVTLFTFIYFDSVGGGGGILIDNFSYRSLTDGFQKFWFLNLTISFLVFFR